MFVNLGSNNSSFIFYCRKVLNSKYYHDKLHLRKKHVGIWNRWHCESQLHRKNNNFWNVSSWSKDLLFGWRLFIVRACKEFILLTESTLGKGLNAMSVSCHFFLFLPPLYFQHFPSICQPMLFLSSRLFVRKIISLCVSLLTKSERYVPLLT